MFNAMIVILIVGIFPLMAYVAHAQPKDAAQGPHATGAKNHQQPARKPGMAAAVEKAANAPAVTTPAPNTYNGKLGSVYAMEQAIARAKAAGVPANIIAQSEAVLAALKADLAATPVPKSAFN